MRKMLVKLSNKVNNFCIFYFKDVKKLDYFTIKVDGKIVSYVFNTQGV